jgi:hypothetical protein
MKRSLLVFLLALAPASQAQNALPDFSGNWGRNAFDLEAAANGPRPVTNLQRVPSGTGDPTRPIADYRNPLLKPEAAEIVRKRSEIAAAGKVFPDPSNQCAPFHRPLFSACNWACRSSRARTRSFSSTTRTARSAASV